MTTPRKTINDLAREVHLTPKQTRRLLRSLGRRLVGEERTYSFNQRGFNIAVREINNRLAALATECDQRCTHSTGDDCECHCGGENHGIHAA